jgi:predicted anti-sigma-YlaC factor YlaD
MTCEETRRHIHEAHDDDRADALPEPVRAHLATCAACRELDDDLDRLSRALRAMPRHPLPADALDAVWRETLHARPRTSTTTVRFWRLAAAASFVSALATVTLYLVFAPVRPPGPSAVELARASAQADIVFGYTARALAATRDAAADRVIASKVSPAVRGIPAPRASRRP